MLQATDGAFHQRSLLCVFPCHGAPSIQRPHQAHVLHAPGRQHEQLAMLLGLQEIAGAMADPFGSDDTDFDTYK